MLINSVYICQLPALLSNCNQLTLTPKAGYHAFNEMGQEVKNEKLQEKRTPTTAAAASEKNLVIAPNWTKKGPKGLTKIGTRRVPRLVE